MQPEKSTKDKSSSRTPISGWNIALIHPNKVMLAGSIQPV
jgi:hypothetical protein